MRSFRKSRLFVTLFFSSFLFAFLLGSPDIALAKKQRGNSPGSAGDPGRGNPSGPIGGPGFGNVPGLGGGRGAGPRFDRPNPNRPHLGPGEGRGLHRGDNPPGSRDGRGTDWVNPVGMTRSLGAGPKWTDNPWRIDNLPGPIGGHGTDWNPPGLIGGEGTNWNPPGLRRGLEREGMPPRVREKRLARLMQLRDKAIAEGAPPERIAKINSKIQKMETRHSPRFSQTTRDGGSNLPL